MAKRYLGGGISFEQKDVYQEFSEEESPSPGGSSTLAGLTDVDISNPSDGQTLVYDATTEKWVNGESAGGGVLVCNVNPETFALDKTWEEITNADYAVCKMTIDADTFIMLMIGYGSYSEQDTTVYGVSFFAYMDNHAYEFMTDSPDGYPAAQTGNN